MTVRRPSERITSHFGFLARNGDVAAEDGVAAYLDAGDAHGLIARSEYRPILDRYVDRFGRDNVLLLPLELLGADPQAYADHLLRFLGLPPRVLGPGDSDKVLAAARPRSRIVARTAHKIGQWMRARGMLGLLGTLKRAKLIRKLLFKPVAQTRTQTDFGRRSAEVAQLDADYPKLLAEWGHDPARMGVSAGKTI